MTTWIQRKLGRLGRLITRSNQKSSPMFEALEDRRLLSAVHHLASAKASAFIKGSHTYTDGVFKAANWELQPVYTGVGGTATAIQKKTGGSPGSYRLITTSVDADSVFFAFNGNKKAIFNPAIRGSISSVNYSELNKLVSGFYEGQRVGPALEQNGQYYFLLDQGYYTPQYTWKKLKITNLTAADFSTLDTGAHPDFSANGAPIEFGFSRANSAGGSGYSIVAAIDSWSVTVKTLKAKKKPTV